MASLKISAIIVVYNKYIGDSVTCKRVKETGTIDVLIIDNSTRDFHNKLYCEKNGLQYLSMHGNQGLSKAYNAGIDQLRGSDVIILLDDDTDVPEKYFEKITWAVENHPDIDIFAPVIRGQDGVIYSPNNYRFLKNELVSSPTEEVRQDRFNAISSCLAIRMRVFDDYRFDERLFVDEIDHCFFRTQREKGRKFGIIDIEIVQNFHQRGETLSAGRAWSRLCIRLKDIFCHARLMGGGMYIFLAFIKCCGLGIQMGMKSKSAGVAIKAVALSCRLMITR